jgi:hypothetical protein
VLIFALSGPGRGSVLETTLRYFSHVDVGSVRPVIGRRGRRLRLVCGLASKCNWTEGGLPRWADERKIPRCLCTLPRQKRNKVTVKNVPCNHVMIQCHSAQPCLDYVRKKQLAATDCRRSLAFAWQNKAGAGASMYVCRAGF